MKGLTDYHIKAGREMGAALMESATNPHFSIQSMSDQMHILQYAAQHILAVCAYNQERLETVLGDTVIEEIADEIKRELSYINRGVLDWAVAGQRLN